MRYYICCVSFAHLRISNYYWQLVMKKKWHKLPSHKQCDCSSHKQFDTTEHHFQFHIQNSNSIAHHSHSPNLKRIHINKSIRSFICLNVSRLVIVYRFAEIHNHLLHIQDTPSVFPFFHLMHCYISVYCNKCI